jgi:leucyl-tRNA synthetase
MAYPFKDIEKKWQDMWEKDEVYRAKDLSPSKKDQKFYGLIEFPYPSGEGLHVGHPRSYTAIDIMTRKKRMEGKDVLYPIGWDAFGLPTENFAIKNKIKPADATAKNVGNFTRQLKSLGFGFDWSREINTTDPAYYKWTQWMFLKFFNAYFDDVEGRAMPIYELAIPDSVRSQGEEAVRAYVDGKRMAYKAETKINWCPKDKIGLANEEVINGTCERCGTPVEERMKKQWMIRITTYADRLIDDLAKVDYLDKIKAQQINWIGRSEGAEITFPLYGVPGQEDGKHTVTVFTTRPDTIFGATFLVISPELAKKWIDVGWQASSDVKTYVEKSLARSEVDRQAEGKDKTGVDSGLKAKNPANGEMIPVFVADYVLGGYGTGAIMAVPAGDERDQEFAQKFGLPIKELVLKENAVEWLEAEKFGKRKKTYRLRDWVFSRQRYWGEPIPIVICKSCGYVPVPDNQLPVVLPEVEHYEPTDTGESPLAAIRSWVETTCPKCDEPAERETDTMPNWAGSSWYFLRYCDPKNDSTFADPEKLKFWMPVDLYNGGMEHTTLHLLYSRFWYKVLFDLDLIPRVCGDEPYLKRRSHALILGEGGVKMSKSKGNVVNPDDVVAEYGADVFRLYEMFIGPFDQDAPWDTNGIEGVKRFLDKVWRLHEDGSENPFGQSTSNETLLHQTIKKVGDDIEAMRFNTAVSAMMILVNELKGPSEAFLKLLAPFAPHIADELWHKMGHSTSIHVESWPKYDENQLQASTFELVIQVNGKVRDRMTVDSNISEEEAKEIALKSEKVQANLGGKTPSKIVYVKGRLVSISV